MKPRKTPFWKIGAYDIETNGLNANKFIFGSCIYAKADGTDETKVFFERSEMLEFMTRKSFQGYRWYAHNAGGYDLIGLLGNYLENEQLKVVINKGRFIQGKWKIQEGKYIYFLDSLNYFLSSLEQLGNDIGLKKGKTPGKFKNGTVEKITKKDIQYCIQDTRIVFEAVKRFNNFLYNNFNISLGTTIAQTAQRIFFTNFQKKDIKVSGLDKFFRKSYYGGRVELLGYKGKAYEPAYYYDFNSLYPSVMKSIKYPDPANLRYARYPNTDILKYEGVSYVNIYVPDMFYPPLPVKANRLIFPIGDISGWYNHNELRMAVNYGAIIKSIKKSIYSVNNINPFKRYVDTLYNFRMQAKKKGRSSESLYLKLLLNSLYGKFGQQIEKREYGFCFEDRPNDWKFESYGSTDIGIWKKFDDSGNLIKEDSKNAILSFASYTTSGARIKLYETIQNYVIKQGYDIIYTDTDSLITNNPYIPTGDKLGQLDMEKKGIFTGYAPKVYKFYDFNKKKIEIKMKGITKPEEIKESYKKKRIIKPVEALRRNLKAGEPIEIEKNMSNIDVKRVWNGKRMSDPINLEVIRTIDEIEKEINEYMDILDNDIKNAQYTQTTLIRDENGQVIDRLGSYSLKPEWYKKAKDQGMKHKDILRQRAIYELEQYNPEFYEKLEKLRRWEDGNNYKEIKSICKL